MLQSCDDNFKKMCLFTMINVKKGKTSLQWARRLFSLVRLERFTVRFC